MDAEDRKVFFYMQYRVDNCPNTPIVRLDQIGSFHGLKIIEMKDMLVNMVKEDKIGKQNNVNIVEFHDRIWNHNEKCIQISTNMPRIGSPIREIVVKISEM